MQKAVIEIAMSISQVEATISMDAKLLYIMHEGPLRHEPKSRTELH